jgi:hypothetical protein
MSWSKLHSDQWLYGSIRKYAPEIRAVWPDLQALGETSPMTGYVCIAPGIAYEKKQLVEILNITLELLLKSLEIFTLEKYIKIDEKGVIKILCWKRYQSEYQRLKKYKEGTKKGTEKGTEKGTPQNQSQNQSQNQIKNQDKNIYPPHVKLTQEEYDRLKKELGKKFLDACIFRLNAYLVNNNKKLKQYKDHNLVIRTWVIDEVKKKIQPEPIIEKKPEQPEEIITEETRQQNLKIIQDITDSLSQKLSVPQGAAS